MTLGIEEDFRKGVEAHSSGQLREAARLYAAVIKVQPGHPGANHNIGVLSIGAGNSEEGIPFFEIALAADPYVEQYWISYISALINLGLIENANRALKKAKKKSLSKLIINQLKSRITQKRMSVAGSQQADPPKDKLEYLVALLKTDNLDTILEKLNQLLKHFPSSALLFNIQGVAHQNAGHYQKAVASYQTAVNINPEYPEALCNMGNAFKHMDNLDAALYHYEQALKIKPGHFECQYNMANLFYQKGDFDQAIRFYMYAIEIKKDFAEAYNNLGLARQGKKDLDGAICSYKQAISIKPDFIDALYNMANALIQKGDLDGALVLFEKTLKIYPGFPEALLNMANTLNEKGNFDQAVQYYILALEAKPDYDGAFSNMLLCKINNPMESDESIFKSHRSYSDRFEKPLVEYWPEHKNVRDPDRHLNVGFVSGDFKDHALADFFVPVVRVLFSMENYTLHAYHNLAIEDYRTADIKQYFAHWNSVSDFSDGQLASKILEDGIDILIDLSGHTAGNRLLAFARKPAPVQASWMGYPGTTGLKSIDYFIGPSFALPFGQHDGQFSEKILGLPLPLPYCPDVDFPQVNKLPALTNGYVTFGSFFRPSKISRAVISVWAGLLREVPESRLVMGGMLGDHKNNKFIKWFNEENIDIERVRFEGRIDRKGYYLLHNGIDIHLAPFPYIGGTTIAAAIKMGVPTLVISGKRLTSSGAASAMYYVGHPEFIVSSKAEFISRGIQLSANLEELSKTRHTLRDKTITSPFYDDTYMHAVLDQALRTMWQPWCDGLDPKACNLSPKKIPGGQAI